MATYLGKRMVEIRPLMDKISTIKEKINEFASRKDVAQKEAEIAAAVLDNIKKETIQLTDNISESEQLINDFVVDGIEVISRCEQAVIASEALSESFIFVLKNLENKIDEANNKLAQINLAKDVAQKEITVQEERLSKRFADLDIYKNRLDKKCKELGIDIIIKL